MQNLTWYLNRLRQMSVPELGYRARRLAQTRVRYLRGDALADPPASLGTGPDASAVPSLTPRPYVQAVDTLLAGRWLLFGRELLLGFPPRWNRNPATGEQAPDGYGPMLDYRDQRLVGDIKYLWEPNRHLELVTLAQAWRLTGNALYSRGIALLLKSWFTQCPYPSGPNWCSALEVAIRLINWAVAWQILGGARSPILRVSGSTLRREWLKMIYGHARFVREHLSRHSSANNHLIGELSGLVVAADTWQGWGELEQWGALAREELVEQTLRQNYPDGVNREQATAYHRFVLEFLLVVVASGHRAGRPQSAELLARMEAMCDFLAAITDAGGHVSMIGDADDGRVLRLDPRPTADPNRTLLTSAAALFDRADWVPRSALGDDTELRWLLSQSVGDLPAKHCLKRPRPRVFPEGGYYLLGTEFDTDNEIRLLADAGPLGYLSIAAHGHADALAFTLSAGGREILVDPGTYAYHSKREWRDYFRGTRAHNTVAIDGLDQSVSGGPFLWTEHAEAHCSRWLSDDELDDFEGWHTGYRRLSDPVTHWRRIRLFKRQRQVLIDDRIECRGDHLAERSWHFAEQCQVSVQGPAIIADNGCYRVRLLPKEAVTVSVARGQCEPPGGWVSRTYDQKTPSVTVRWACRVRGTTQLQTVIDCTRIANASDDIEGQGVIRPREGTQ